MARRRIEMIEEYLMPNDEYHDYEYHDNHGVLVRCRDCEHSYFASNRAPDEQCWVCGKHGIDVTPDWFCADGEQKEDDHAT